MSTDKDYLWWRDGVIYQIYPRSFADSNGDGIGDLPGIIDRLDYLEALGIDAIWLSPFYPSPDVDFGYDISDHCAVDPRLGTMEDFDRLVAGCRQRGLRVIVDLVLNHTSDQHPWFQAALSGRDNPKRDWYIWQDRIPNNWHSVFGGRAWRYDASSGQYYFHLFVKEQPDLNWRNPAVRKAQLDVVRFWLDRGVDGFRLDVFNAYFKDGAMRSNPPKPGLRAFDRQRHLYDIDQPEMFPLLRELRQLIDGHDQAYAVGETFEATPQRAAAYCGPDLLHAAFNFTFTKSPYSARAFRQAIETWEAASGPEQWPNYVLSNHDLPRAASRYCRGADDAPAAIVMAMLLSLRGTPFLYYGEELGQRDIRLRRSEILDPPGRYYWPFFKGRDGCRAPMQWDAGQNAGFTPAKPWLPAHPDHLRRNVAAQEADPASMLQLTRALIRLRRDWPAMRRGSLAFIDSPAQVLAYRRDLAGSASLGVALDFSGRNRDYRLAGQELFSALDGRIRICRLD